MLRPGAELERAVATDDPLRALAALARLRGELEPLIREKAVRALRAGRSYGDIARALGISRQAAHRRYREFAVPRVAATAETRRLLRVAREEAATSNAPALGSEHLLVAAVRCGAGAAATLAAAGVTLERARTSARAVAAGRARSPMPGASPPGVRAIVREAARIAAVRGERWLDTDTLILSALADPNEGACRLLAALAVDPAVIRRGLSRHAGTRASRTDRDAA